MSAASDPADPAAGPAGDHGVWFQQAYLVDDLDRAATLWHERYGAGPFFVTEHHRTDTFDYRGTDQEADVSYAFGYLGDMMIQFIVQHDDTPSIYLDMYPDGTPPGGLGFHHSGFLVPDVLAATQRMVDRGFDLATRLYADGVDATYVDTRALNGGFTEYHGTPPHILDTFARWREAHRAHRPTDPPTVRRRQGT